MDNKQKIINDPVYGFIRIPNDLIFELISHPYFQRLRRISQGGLASLVYPGATHTRFHHSLGAMHLMYETIAILRQKRVSISDEEAQALLVATLLHDVGHGPYSHALESKLIAVSHEQMSMAIMKQLNQEFGGALDLAIQIFRGKYNRPFMTALIASQLDVDRLDYLSRDSFYTGVVEGHVGYNRILQMMNVHNGQLVIEEKGVLSIEKFLLSRKHMYLQVYLHHTCLAAEVMLDEYISQLKFELFDENRTPETELERFLILTYSDKIESEIIEHFCALDDSDVLYQIKKSAKRKENMASSYLAKRLIDRKIYKVKIFNSEEECDESVNSRLNSVNMEDEGHGDLSFPKKRKFDLRLYDFNDEIVILKKNGETRPYSEILNGMFKLEPISKYYLCY